MLNIRQMGTHELAAFAAIGTPAAEAAVVEAYLEKMIGLGSIRPEWCFIIEEDGQACGRIAYWTIPKSGVPVAMVLLELPWERSDYLPIGSALLTHTLPLMQAIGASSIEYVLDQPAMAPQFQHHLKQRLNFLEQAGFSLQRETNRFEWKTDSTLPPHPHALRYRSLPEVGEAAYIDAIMQASKETLDQRIAHDRQRLGEREHALDMFRELQELEYQPDWWQLAYDANDELVGFVMPAKAPAFATIAYIGVVPAQRGLGYVDSLLRQGTAILLAAGETVIRTDTDTRNTPMGQSFLRAGYTQFAQRREYSLKLPK